MNSHDVALLNTAEQQLTMACMQHHGFKYFSALVSSTPAMQNPLPYVIPSISEAKHEGFGLQDLADPNQVYLSHMSGPMQQQYALALFGAGPPVRQVTVPIPQGGIIGHSAGGCQAYAEQALYGSFPQWFQLSTLVENYQAILHSEVISSPIFLARLQSWRSCVRAAGFTWITPAFAISRYTSQPGHLSTGEITAAVTVADCATHTQLAVTAKKIYSSYLSKLPHDYREEVAAYLDLEGRAVAKARAITGTAGSNLSQKN